MCGHTESGRTLTTSHHASDNVVLAITGASGSAYAVRLAQVLLGAGMQLHIVISSAARQVMQRELEQQPPVASETGADWPSFLQPCLSQGPAEHWGFRPLSISAKPPGALRVHHINDYAAGIASGSFLTRGMVICPCSMGTLSAIAGGISGNLIQRAADVHLKERRPLIVVPRETPLGLIALENMVRLTHAGATVMPAMPGYYHQPESVGDLVDFVVARICDHLQIEHSLISRWGQ